MENSFKTLCGIASELGEGPTYDAQSNTLYWFDIVGKRLFEKPFGKDGLPQKTIIHPLPFMASALGVIDGNRQLIVAENGLYIRDTKTNALSLHLPLEAENSITRSNDARVHPSGSFWIGTMGKSAEQGAGAIYWVRGSEIKLLYEAITIPNAICFAPDGATAYFTDTVTALLMQVACDPASGLPIAEPTIFYDHRSGEGGLDGAICDADGHIWNTRWGASALDCYSPDGTRIRTINMPATQPSCPAFCGPNLSAIAVTSAWQNMDINARQSDPLAGQTFWLDLGVKGRKEPHFKL